LKKITILDRTAWLDIEFFDYTGNQSDSTSNYTGLSVVNNKRIYESKIDPASHNYILLEDVSQQ
jgi:hypothetical protein